jgi:hypothetical protein
MNKILRAVFAAIMVMTVAYSFLETSSAAGAAKFVSLPTYNVGGVSLVKTISSAKQFDSLTGVAKTITLLKDFTPSGAGIYVLALDTCSTLGSGLGALANARAILRLYAKDGKGGNVIGYYGVDSLASGAAAGLYHQFVIPFNDKLVGTCFDVKLEGTATDSFYVNRAYLYKVQNTTVTPGIMGR